jgi:parallel beta-helix repeat protein
MGVVVSGFNLNPQTVYHILTLRSGKMLKITCKIMSMTAVFLMISGWAAAGNLEPPGGPAPTMNTLKEIYDKVAIGTEIKFLPYEIDSPGFYYITQDLTSPAGTHGITITADNVTLDLMGFSLIGHGGTGNYDGVFMDGRTNVEIRNGTIMNFRFGIHENNYNSKGHLIINVKAVSNETGIYLNSKGNMVNGCKVLSNIEMGIYVGAGSSITGNTAHDNGSLGIITHNGSIITGNTVYGNGFGGIQAGSGSTVTGNTAHDNISLGILAGYGSTVNGNTAYQNENGIYAYNGSTITGNTAFNNSSTGINAFSGSTVIGNTARDNGAWGIYLGGPNLVDQNTAYNNTLGDMNVCQSCEFGTNVPPQN